jgi:translation elongation factor P/translation initiation factor 5A
MNIKISTPLCLILLAAMLSFSFSDTAIKKTKKPGKWVSLIQKNSTAGWHGYLSTKPIGWKVENGILYTPGKQGDIVTDKIYKNFELSMEWKINTKGNSGVFINVLETPKYKRMYETGPEFQIIDNENYPQELTASQKTGSLSDVIPPSGAVVKNVGEWNHTRILVNNRHVEHWLNGKKILAYELGSKDLKDQIAKSKFAKLDYAQAEEGRIGLQDHGDPVYFKNIKIKVL